MNTSNDSALAELAAYLSARRDAFLNNWRTSCENDPVCNTVANLSREEFNNKVPFMLNELNRQFRNEPVQKEITLLAAEHGLHRWQKGYTLAELLSEIHHLNRLMMGEVRQYWHQHPVTDSDWIAESYESLAWFTQQNIQGSVEQYIELQRIAASNRMQTLQQALDELNDLKRRRGDLLRSASHDLRGSFGVIQGAASFLNLVEVEEPTRKQMVEILNRNMATVRDMVLQLMDLSRLEAGQEPVTFQSFNAGQFLYELVESYQPLAAKTGLLLKADGPTDLRVESDPVQLQRIMQNLVLNALNNATTGWVSVSWARESAFRWVISVQDSGPGLPKGSSGTLLQALAPTTESSAAFGVDAPAEERREADITRSPKTAQGEGIGLSIVKGLCELLRASLEVETKAGEGTLFRIRLAINQKTPG
ncbi:sensor histidine kinase [Larkinella bovis]|uniref:histidine kinase n=1 Tax=Larkinella bovis TaxID=683041 RepID=A0ABW0ICZ9_9BACT